MPGPAVPSPASRRGPIWNRAAGPSRRGRNSGVYKRRFFAWATACLGAFGVLAAYINDTYGLFGIVTALFHGAVPVTLPGDTGWIFCGYYDQEQQLYIDNYCTVKHSPYPEKSVIPRIGETIRLSKTRRLVIADFASLGLSRVMEPPWKQNILKPSDYTGIQLPSGVTVAVRAVSLGAFPGHPAAVWVRIGKLEE